MLALMFFWLKVSLAAVKTAIARTPAARARLEALAIGDEQRKAARSCAPETREDLLGACHLGHPPRRDEGPDLDHGQACVEQAPGRRPRGRRRSSAAASF